MGLSAYWFIVGFSHFGTLYFSSFLTFRHLRIVNIRHIPTESNTSRRQGPVFLPNSETGDIPTSGLFEEQC